MKPQLLYLLILEVSGQIFDKVIACKINSSDIYDVEKPISFKKRKQENVIQSGEKFSTLLIKAQCKIHFIFFMKIIVNLLKIS